VLQRFPDRAFLIDLKTGSSDDAAAVAAVLQRLPESRRQQLAAYGGDAAMQTLTSALPSFRVMSKSSLIRAALQYLAIGWTGYVPASCRGTELHIPLRFAPLFWGWPHRFIERMAAVDTRVIIVAGKGRWSEGFDSLDRLQTIPAGYAGVIWTNRIDRIGPVLKPELAGGSGSAH
jgi:glycerophosphoryl diester phosphodiesterase